MASTSRALPVPTEPWDTETKISHPMFDGELSPHFHMTTRIKGLRIVQGSERVDPLFSVVGGAPIEIEDLRDHVVMTSAEYARLLTAAGEQPAGSIGG